MLSSVTHAPPPMRPLVLILALLNITGPVYAQFTLVETKGTFRTDATNLALGATAVASNEYGFPHFATNVNDGTYGNASSWLGSASNLNAYIGLGFSTPISIGSIAFGRDNTGTYTDRAAVRYWFEYSTNYVPGSPITTGNWTQVGPTLFEPAFNYISSPPPDPSFRHLYNIDTIRTGVTGIRFDVPAVGNNTYQGAAIDEIEVYATHASAIPEPSTYAAFAGLAALGLAAWRRRAVRLSGPLTRT